LAKVLVRLTTQDIPFGHGARCPATSRARRPTEIAPDWCARLEGGLFWCGRECAVGWPMQSVVAGMGTQPYWNPSDTSFAVRPATRDIPYGHGAHCPTTRTLRAVAMGRYWQCRDIVTVRWHDPCPSCYVTRMIAAHSPVWNIGVVNSGVGCSRNY